ncbi:MAG: polysaccharide pyruvyl transferase family protein [Lachnospiraceae bacterium]|nr:polysaccharide pyruvyl transferase family protein [Lachnospiraceae bacterium]
MHKYIMRSGMAPTDIFDPTHILLKNSIGNNVGNLVYAWGVYRALTVEDTEIVPNYYEINTDDADFINETYDAYIIPLADAFRNNFKGELYSMTKLIKKLKIPVIVIGVGLRAPFGTDLTGFGFDDEVKKFCSAVLDKSAMIGVRGELTARYLTNLGFVEGKHHTVIGCPSMYANGKHIKIKDLNLTKDSTISVNSNILSPAAVLNFLNRTMDEIPNHYFLPQRIQEMKTVYLGEPYIHQQKNKEMYPTDIAHPLYKENRVRFMLNAPGWFEFLKGVDLSIGGRLHGNVAATVAGTPALFLPHDARTRELTDYHQFTHVWAKDIKPDTDVFDLVSKLDFHSPEKVHQKNFEHYVEFLDANGLDHIWKDGADPEVAPLDKIMENVNVLPPLECISSLTTEELAARYNEYYPVFEKRYDAIREEVKALRGIKKAYEKLNINVSGDKSNAGMMNFAKKVYRKLIK